MYRFTQYPNHIMSNHSKKCHVCEYKKHYHIIYYIYYIVIYVYNYVDYNLFVEKSKSI